MLASNWLLAEQRPSQFVQRLLVEQRIRAQGQHLPVGVGGVAVATFGEQRLGPAEVALGYQGALRVFTYQAVQCGERSRRVAVVIVRARKLIEHLVVTRMIRVLSEQLLVQSYGCFGMLALRGVLPGRFGFCQP